jgi:hypothetical protein
MREIFETPAPRDPGRVFYTIRRADVRKIILRTEIGPIYLTNVIGYVLPVDVGRRLYRVLNEAGDSWLWQCESIAQRDQRLAKN